MGIKRLGYLRWKSIRSKRNSIGKKAVAENSYSENYTNLEKPALTSLTIGELELSPSFNSNVLSYTLNTTNATNTLRVEAIANSQVEILINGVEEKSGTSVKWKEGVNEIEINVTIGSEKTTYKIEVLKEL